MSSSPHGTAEQLQRLVDLEDIRALVASFARSIDQKDQQQYAANFVEDGELELPFGTRVGRASIAAMSGPPPGTHSHHQLGQIEVELTGDTARATTYVTATHVFSETRLTEKAHSGGWYEQQLRRTSDGWRFTRVRLVIRWEDARPMIPADAAQIGAVHDASSHPDATVADVG